MSRGVKVKGKTGCEISQHGNLGGIMEIQNPYVIVFDNGHGVQTRIQPGAEMGYQAFGILIADLIRHVARCFEVDEREVIEWINNELVSPTSQVEGGNVQ